MGFSEADVRVVEEGFVDRREAMPAWPMVVTKCSVFSGAGRSSSVLGVVLEVDKLIELVLGFVYGIGDGDVTIFWFFRGFFDLSEVLVDVLIVVLFLLSISENVVPFPKLSVF